MLLALRAARQVGGHNRVGWIEDSAGSHEAAGGHFIHFIESSPESFQRHETKIRRYLFDRLPSLEHTSGHDHPLQIHPCLRRKTDVAQKRRIQIALAASQGRTNIRYPIAFAQGQFLQTISLARECLDHTPCLYGTNEPHEKSDLKEGWLNSMINRHLVNVPFRHSS